MDEIVVVGGGGHGKVVIGLARKAGYSVRGYVDPEDRGEVLGAPWLGDDEVLPSLLASSSGCSAALGLGKVDAASHYRLELLEKLRGLGFCLPAIVSPDAVVNEAVQLGEGAVVMDGAVVNAGASVGSGCILNSNCTVEHDCSLGDNVHIAPGATLSGAVGIGDHSMVGTGAIVIQEVRITAGCLVGAGAVAVRDLEQPATYVGNPARKLRP